MLLVFGIWDREQDVLVGSGLEGHRPDVSNFLGVLPITLITTMTMIDLGATRVLKGHQITERLVQFDEVNVILRGRRAASP
jgi:hypothetical protein